MAYAGTMFTTALQRPEKVRGDSVQTELYLSTLPPPPIGQTWVKDLEGNWALVTSSSPPSSAAATAASIGGSSVDDDLIDRIDQALAVAKVSEEDGSAVKEPPKYIEHLISSTDTLAGLALRYNTSATMLRRINGFNGDSFRMCGATLKVPFSDVNFVEAVKSREDANLPANKVSRFRSITGVSESEARFYLEGHDYSVESALIEFKEDAQFEKEHATTHHDSVNKHGKAFSSTVKSSSKDKHSSSSVTSIISTVASPFIHVSKQDASAEERAGLLEDVVEASPAPLPALMDPSSSSSSSLLSSSSADGSCTVRRRGGSREGSVDMGEDDGDEGLASVNLNHTGQSGLQRRRKSKPSGSAPSPSLN